MGKPQKASRLIRQKSDPGKWEAFKEGDDQAYAEIYRDYIGELYSYGKKLCKNSDIVEDAIQDVFTELWRLRRNLGQVRSIKFYLLSCLRRQLIKRLNKDRRLVLNENYLIEDNFEFVSSEQELMISDQRELEEIGRLKKALNTLSKRQKEVIYLKFFQNLSYQDISSMMGLNQRSTYNLVSKAIQILKEKLILWLTLLLAVF